MYWPRHLLGVRIHGAPAPSQDQLRATVEGGALWALRNFELDYRGLEQRLGRESERWHARPLRQDEGLHSYETWLDRAWSMPLAVELKEEDGETWYAMALDALEIEPQLPPQAFDFRFPSNAVVFEWDLRDEGQPLDQLSRQMNFPLLVPSALPEGLEISKAVKGRHMLPMALISMVDGERWLSLSQARRLPGALDRSVGPPVDVGGNDGVLVLAGAFSSVSWNQGDTALTLVGNLPYPELLAVAASVEEL